MHGATLLDAADKVLRPCILWNDTRSHAEAAELDADPRFRKITGNIVFPGFTAPKLAWVKNNEPEIFAKVREGAAAEGLSAALADRRAYVGDVGFGRHVLARCRRSAAGRAELLAATDLDEKQMPRLVEGTDQAGTLRAELASRWGLASGVVVAGGAGDNAASACGMGTVKPGHAFVSLGTSGVLFAANGAYLPNPRKRGAHLLPCAAQHLAPDGRHPVGDGFAQLAVARSPARAPADLTARTRRQRCGKPTGVTFLPYLSGERTPHNDAVIRGSFTGLGA